MLFDWIYKTICIVTTVLPQRWYWFCYWHYVHLLLLLIGRGIILIIYHSALLKFSKIGNILLGVRIILFRAVLLREIYGSRHKQFNKGRQLGNTQTGHFNSCTSQIFNPGYFLWHQKPITITYGGQILDFFK